MGKGDEKVNSVYSSSVCSNSVTADFVKVSSVKVSSVQVNSVKVNSVKTDSVKVNSVKACFVPCRGCPGSPQVVDSDNAEVRPLACSAGCAEPYW